MLKEKQTWATMSKKNRTVHQAYSCFLTEFFSIYKFENLKRKIILCLSNFVLAFNFFPIKFKSFNRKKKY